jgi:hypothetical protein
MTELFRVNPKKVNEALSEFSQQLAKDAQEKS